MPLPVADAGLLDFNGTFIAELIAFILMIVVLAKVAYPRIISAATEREKQIEAGLRASQEAQQRLEQVEAEVRATLDEAREQAREIVARSHSDAVVEAQDVLGKARADAEALLQRAETEIGAERDRAIQDLRREVAALVVEATSVVIRERLDAGAHERLIGDALEKVSGSGTRSGAN